MSNFLRKYSLQITPTTGTAKVFTDLQIEFTVTKVADSTMNDLKLMLYNISEDTKGLLTQDKDTVISLLSAYRNGTWTKIIDDAPLELLFKGTIFSIQTTRNGADVITNLQCKDGNVPLREARAARQWPEGVTLEQIVTDLVSQYFVGVSVGEVFGDALQVKFQNGFSARGPVRKTLDNLAKRNKMQWNITDGVFNMFPENSTLQESQLLVTGVLGTPEPAYQDPNQLKNTTDIPAPSGVKFRTLLNPKFKPAKKITVDAVNIKGSYKVEKVVHKGSYRGQVWETNIQAVALK